MAFGASQKLGLSGVLMLAGMAVLALFVAFVAVPWISQASGTNESTVTYAVAALAFIVAIGAALWAKALNKKK
jgi:hypothetical protein